MTLATRPTTLPPSVVWCTTRDHLSREVEIVAWATLPAMRHHRPLPVAGDTMTGLDESQVDAATMMLSSPRRLVTVVGPAGAGKTTMLAAAVENWRRADVAVVAVELDTLHRFEHSLGRSPGLNVMVVLSGAGGIRLPRRCRHHPAQRSHDCGRAGRSRSRHPPSRSVDATEDGVVRPCVPD